MKKISSLLLISLMVIGLFSVFNFNVKAQIVGSGSIDSGLVGYWRLDNNLLDSSGNNDNGIFNGLGNSYVLSNRVNAINFNGSGSVGLGLSLLGSVFTLSVWVKMSTVVSEQCIYSEGHFTDNFGNKYLSITSLGTLHFVFRNDVGTYLINSNPTTGRIDNSSWNFILCTYNSTYFSVYLNNVLVDSGSAIYLTTTPLNSNIGVLNRTSTSMQFIGSVDDLRIYNRVLSNSEISILYNGEIITVTHDSGSTITPNGTVYVGVDQNQTFIVGANSGYVNWVNYFDSVPLAPSSLYLLSGVQSSHSLFITSQFIGDNPTNTPILVTDLPINSFTNSIGNFPYLAQLLLVSGIVIMLILSMLYLKKRSKL